MTITTILTDIEGTTSSIAFVKDVLFPYAARALPDFVRAHREQPEIMAILAQTADAGSIARDDLDALIAQLLAWLHADQKITPLKTLQGLIWRSGYENGAYRAHMYTDAVAALREWHAQGLKIYVYSSGSIAAQQLFFKYSEAGDLTPLLSGYFDTTTGPKQAADSYRTIVTQIGAAPTQILFLSDVAAELDAARATGLQTILLQRPADIGMSTPAADHSVVATFAAIDPTRF